MPDANNETTKHEHSSATEQHWIHNNTREFELKLEQLFRMRCGKMDGFFFGIFRFNSMRLIIDDIDFVLVIFS